MKKLINLISEEVTKAFVSAGYDEKYGKVTLSNRPDLCEFQCNGAMAAAKEYKCAPFMISDKVAALLESDEMFESVESVKPGFLNIKMDTAFLAKYMNDMKDDEGRYGLEKAKKPLTIVVDYGGPNVAKPLHVGHLRSAVIGESVKRIAKFMGHNVIGDVHLGAMIFGKISGLWSYEAGVTAGLCCCNIGGSGDLAVLSAANRMNLLCVRPTAS